MSALSSNSGLLGQLPRRSPSQPIPVTLLSGFLGAGKTTLLKRVLQDRGHKMKIAVVVNDMGALNIDADEIKRHKLVQEEAQMVEFHNGCICCTLRGDLLKTIKQLSEEADDGGTPTWDYVVIESTGISEPLPVAQTFVMDVSSCGPMPPPTTSGEDSAAPTSTSPTPSSTDRDGSVETVATESESASDSTSVTAKDFEPLSKYAQLDTLVTVVDLYNVLHILGGDQSAPGERERLVGDEKDNGDKKPTSLYKLLVDQLEFANVILLNKVDLVHPENAEARHRRVMQVGRLVRKFNPDAKVLVPGYKFDFANSSELSSPDKPTTGRLTVSKFKDFDVAQIINTHLFDMQKAQLSAGWIRELQIDLSGVGHTPETEEYGIGSFVWRTDKADPRPFHPTRLALSLKGFGHLLPEDGTKPPEGVFQGVVRSKGQLWLANCNAIQIEFHSVGRHAGLQSAMPFLAAIPRKKWNEGAWRQYMSHTQAGLWHGSIRGFGDRASVLVIIGVGLTAERKKLIIDALNGALLTDAEMAAGKDAFNKDVKDHPWKKFPDHFFNGRAKEMWEIIIPDEEGKENGEQLGRKEP